MTLLQKPRLLNLQWPFAKNELQSWTEVLGHFYAFDVFTTWINKKYPCTPPKKICRMVIFLGSEQKR